MKSGWFDDAVKCSALLVGSCVAGNAIGAGFSLNEISAGAAGTAYAGRAANPEDASVMAANPAGIAFLDQMQFTVGGGLILPHEKYTHGEGSDSIGGDVQNSSVKGDFVSAQGVPFGFFSMPLDEPLYFGLGFYVPYAAMTEYGDDFVGRYLALNTELVTLNLQPTLSWKFNDSFAVGFGLVVSYLDGELTQRKGSATIKDSKSKMTGHDWGYGWNAGLLWHVNEATSIGLAYTSKINYTVDGDLKLRGSLLNEESDGHLKLILPEKWEFSATHKLDTRWTLLAGAVWTRWSRFDEIKAIADDGLTGGGVIPPIPPGGVASYTPENWKDVWAWSVGASYRYSNEWLLRAGYGYDTSPVKSAWRTARIPDIDRQWLTLGASYQPVPDYTIDLAYGHMFSKNVKVDEREYVWDNATGEVARGGGHYKANYKISANVLVMSLTHRL